MDHWALGVEYDGHEFHGFQIQKDQHTVQSELEIALSQIANHPIKLVTAGRTDTGVHATGQVVSFSTHVKRHPDAWIRGTNSLTSSALTIHWSRYVEADFSARFSALSRRYVYIWHHSEITEAITRNIVTSTTQVLDETRMHVAAQLLMGEHDFSSFRASGCQSLTAKRSVLGISVHRFGNLVVLDICANAFLQHMVRNIAGSLYQVGIGQRPPEWMAELLGLRDRTQAAPTASPKGLYLVHVKYPDEFRIPGPHLPILLQNVEI